VSSTQQVASSLQLIRDLSQRSVDKIGDVAGAIKEQSQASQDVARNVEQIAQMNDSTNRSVQESNQLAQQLKDLSAALNDSLNRFRV
jgi:methyl-accepting chemotaxis protein